MFSGIIQTIGKIISIEPKAEGYLYGLESKAIFNKAGMGSSISVNGVCLSVFKKKNNTIFFEVMPETLRKTTLGEKKVGDIVNLEASLRLGGEIGGHLVFGHVDGVGRIADIKKEGDNVLITIAPPAKLFAYFCPQGSVALDGVSLTIARLSAKRITMSLIEDTLKKTTLGNLRMGDKVNVECDMLAKYVAEQLKKYNC